MLILPIKLLTKDEQYLVGDDVYNLSKLSKSGFPVADGWVIFPPNLNNYQYNPDLLEKFILKLSIPDELVNELQKKVPKLDIQKVWQQLLKGWLSQLSINPSKYLGQTIFCSNKIIASGRIQLKEKNGLPYPFSLDSDIEMEEGILSPLVMKQLHGLAEEMDKFLGIPQTYHFIIDEVKKTSEIKIVKLSPQRILPILDKKLPTKTFLINGLPRSKLVGYPQKAASSFGRVVPVASSQGFADQNKIKDNLSPLKIYLHYQSGLPFNDQISGLLIDGKSFKGSGEKMEVLQKIASELNKEVIYKIDSLEEDSKVVRYLRNKRHFLNIQIAISGCNFVNKLINIKQELASLGVARKGSLKFWFEVITPENIINIEEYIEVGLDGVIINFDTLLEKINDAGEQTNFTSYQILPVLKFLEEGLRTLHKLKIPVMASGKSVVQDDILKFILTRGFYAICILDKGVDNFLDDLVWHQKHVHKSLLIGL